MPSIESWEDLNWEVIEHQVFRLQRRIFEASKRGNRTAVYRLQRLLISSKDSRYLAVRKVATENKGKNTPGVDGVRTLTDRQKLELSCSINLDQEIQPVVRKQIPKTGSNEMRPLGIPTMRDRALQQLIALALMPEWEAKFTSGMFGFRKGYRCQDAIATLWRSIVRTPQYCLDCDVEKFFDRIDHEALLRKIDTFPKMRQAIRRLLKSGICDGTGLIASDEGTPQGGPLSPLLANVVMTGLETALVEGINSNHCKKKPKVVIYADDLVVLHPSRAAVEYCRRIIEEFLAPFGLNLHRDKTNIVHTLEKTEQPPGFNFLGFRIQQHRVGKYAMSPWFKGVFTHICPSRKSREAAIHESVRGRG